MDREGIAGFIDMTHNADAWQIIFWVGVAVLVVNAIYLNARRGD
jgi:hypothetical protein